MENPFTRLSIRGWFGFFAVASSVIILDQTSKLIILNQVGKGQTIEVIPGLFNLVLAFNLGAAFGMLANLGEGTRQLVLMGTTMLALFVVFFFLLYEYNQSVLGRFALAMIFGGALGNIIDRLRLGMVVDFLDFYIKNNHWPAFNVADSSICIAVFLLLFQRPSRKKKTEKSS
jgi:signal peptidase II